MSLTNKEYKSLIKQILRERDEAFRDCVFSISEYVVFAKEHKACVKKGYNIIQEGY